MAFVIGQKRSVDFDAQLDFRDIINNVSIVDNIQSENPFDQNTYFLNSGLSLSSPLQVNQVYYLRLVFIRPDNAKNIKYYIKLQQDNLYYQTQTIDSKQRSLKAKVSDTTTSNYVDIVFTPLKSYNKIVFEIARGWDDYQIQNQSDVNNCGGEAYINGGSNIQNGRRIRLDEACFSFTLWKLKELMTDGYWKKVGVQSRPGSLVVINKEPIRLGRSGIYELNNGTKITSFMIVPDTRGYGHLDPFLVDYIAYQNESQS